MIFSGKPNPVEPPSVEKEIKVDLELKNGLPFAKIKIGSTRYHLMLTTWFPDILLFSRKTCENKVKNKGEEGKLNAALQADLQMCGNIQTFDDLEVFESEKKGSFEILYRQGKLKGYYMEESIEDLQAKQSYWLARIVPQSVMDGFSAALGTMGSMLPSIGLPAPEQNKEALDYQCNIGVLTEWPPELADMNAVGQFDGLLGLMILPVKNNRGSPLINYLIKNHKIDNKKFGLSLNLAQGSGTLVLGGINPSYNNFLHHVPVIPDGPGWLINIDSIKVGSTELQKNLKAYVDTSTTQFFGKNDIISKINTELGAKEQDNAEDIDTGESTQEKLWVYENCKNPPNLTLTIDGKEYILDSYSTVERTFGLCTTTFNNAELIDYDLILGSYFLNKYYAVFDEEKKIISFAEARVKKRTKLRK